MAAFAKNLFRWMGGGSPESPAPLTPIAPPPAPDTASMAAVAERRKRRMGLTAPARGGTQLTGPAGITGAPPIERSTILGG